MTTLSIHIALNKKTVLNYHRLKRIIYDEHLKHLLDGRRQEREGAGQKQNGKEQ